jgi:DNA-binding XRE family transcriptional regulator
VQQTLRAMNSIRPIRREKGLTQADLSAATGLPLTTIARIDSNPCAMPRLETAVRISRALGVDVEELFSGCSLEAEPE